MHTIGRLAELFGLSRSTLLYYDAVGLLKPSHRSEAGYRLYAEDDCARLEKIRLFRGMGVPLERIASFLSRPDEGITPMLLRRLLAINAEIDGLRDQQREILRMLEEDGSLKGVKPRLHGMRELGKKAGITEQSYKKVHRVFQRTSPKEHRRFLRYLGFTNRDIEILMKKIAK
jgi:DNA-binding transcriptional MerR regulator